MMEKKEIISQLRKCSRVPGKQKTWISGVTDEIIYEIFIRLKNNENARSIAREIKGNVPALSDSDVRSISYGIIKFKKRINHLLKPPIQCESIKFDDAKMNFDDPIGMCQQAIILQATRISVLADQEMETDIYNPLIIKEMETFLKLYKGLFKYKKAKDRYDKNGGDRLHHFTINGSNIDTVKRYRENLRRLMKKWEKRRALE